MQRHVKSARWGPYPIALPAAADWETRSSVSGGERSRQARPWGVDAQGCPSPEIAYRGFPDDIEQFSFFVHQPNVA